MPRALQTAAPKRKKLLFLNIDPLVSLANVPESLFELCYTPVWVSTGKRFDGKIPAHANGLQDMADSGEDVDLFVVMHKVAIADDGSHEGVDIVGALPRSLSQKVLILFPSQTSCSTHKGLYSALGCEHFATWDMHVDYMASMLRVSKDAWLNAACACLELAAA